jgi:hypothetical protein
MRPERKAAGQAMRGVLAQHKPGPSSTAVEIAINRDQLMRNCDRLADHWAWWLVCVLLGLLVLVFVQGAIKERQEDDNKSAPKANPSLDGGPYVESSYNRNIRHLGNNASERNILTAGGNIDDHRHVANIRFSNPFFSF